MDGLFFKFFRINSAFLAHSNTSKRDYKHRFLCVHFFMARSLLSGSIFGTIPALRISPRNKNVIAIRKSLVLRLDRPMLDRLNPAVINKFNVEFIKVLFRRVAEMNIKVAWERGEIMRITSAYGMIKDELDKTPSLSKEVRITSNLMYEQLKNIQRPDE